MVYHHVANIPYQLVQLCQLVDTHCEGESQGLHDIVRRISRFPNN